jgi:hypothetical protein
MAGTDVTAGKAAWDFLRVFSTIPRQLGIWRASRSRNSMTFSDIMALSPVQTL